MKIISNLSSSRKTKFENKRQALINKVRYVASDQNLILNYKIDAAYWLLRAVILLAMGTLLFAFAKHAVILELITFVIAAIFIARSSQWLNVAKNKYKIAKLAIERIKQVKIINAKFYDAQYGVEYNEEEINTPEDDEISKWELNNIN